MIIRKKTKKYNTKKNKTKQYRVKKQIFFKEKDLHFLNITLLLNFLTRRYELKSRTRNNLTRKQQYKIRKNIIIARELSLLPHIKYS